jgi:hypothetical protein
MEGHGRKNRLIIAYLGIYKEKISLSFFSLKKNTMSRLFTSGCSVGQEISNAERADYDLTQPPVKYNKAGFGNVYLRPHNSAEDYTCGVTWARFKSNEIKGYNFIL